MKRFTLFLILGWLVAGLASAQDFDPTGEAAMLARINEARAAENLPPLMRNGGLDAAARAHCADMATQQQLTHVSESSGTPADRVRRAGVTATTIAENVALHQSAVSAHEALLASPAHRQNMMSRSVTHVGLAALPTAQGVYVTQVFAAIGLPAPAEPPAAASPVVPEIPAPSIELSPDLPEPPAADQAPTPAAPSVAMQPIPSDDGEPVLEAQAGTNGTVVHELRASDRHITAYWIYGNGRWWYYPLPEGSVPGQQLQADRSVQGPPPGFPEHPNGARIQNQGPMGVPGAPPPQQQRLGAGTPEVLGPRAYGVGPNTLSIPGPGPGMGVVISPGGAFYAPPPPMVGNPDPNWQRAHRQWLRRYRLWQRQQRHRRF